MADEIQPQRDPAGELSVAELVRAGRLDPLHVRLAAYLGDERALAAGLERWEPRDEDQVLITSSEWAAIVVLKHSPLELRWTAPFACELAERALRGCWVSQDSRPRDAIQAARAWLEGGVNDDEDWSVLEAAYDAANDAERGITDDDPLSGPARAARTAHAAVCATEAARIAAGSSDRSRGGERRTWAGLAAEQAATDEQEQAWQNRRLAECLLTPGWPTRG